MKTEPIYRIFGHELRRCREEIGISRVQAANLLKIGQTSLANIEHGRSRIHLHHAYRIAHILKIDMNRLIPQSKADLEWQNYLDELDGVE